LDKVTFLLEAIEAQQKNITYYALDLSAEELVSTLQAMPTQKFQHVSFAGLHGTFEDGLFWLKDTPAIRDLPHHILLFGLTIGNFSRQNAASFLRDIARSALSGKPTESSIIVSLDSCKLPTKVLRAYTCEGVVPFALTGLKHGNSLLNQMDKENNIDWPAFNIDEWYFLSEWNYSLGRHEASLIPRCKDITLGPPLSNITICKDEKVRFGCSYKYDEEERQTLFRSASLENVASWGEKDCDVAFYGLRLKCS
jgi:4-dimethylallyltryptophan N-methyltransferase